MKPPSIPPIRLLIVVLLAFFGSFAAADDTAATSFAPTDLTGLKGKVGQTVEIAGTPTGVGTSNTGNVIYLNFDRKPHTSVSIVFFTSGGRSGSVKSADDLKPFVGKPVTVKGELGQYKDDLQIVLQSVDDIHVTE